jgi:hypothetical protein
MLPTLRNIGETGMLIASRHTFEISQNLVLRLVFPVVLAGRLIQTLAVIVRAQAGEHMAVEFVDTSDSFREALAQYVERTLTKTPRL